MLGVLLISLTLQAVPSDVKTAELKDGYVRITTPSYSVEIPKGWSVGRETPWGDRKFGAGDSGQMGVMTAGRTQSSWDELYRVSLFYINREEKGKATPYELGKTDQGYQTMSFSVLDSKGFAKRRYVLLKDKNDVAIALSIKIAKPEGEKEMAKHFDRMVRSARILGE